MTYVFIIQDFRSPNLGDRGRHPHHSSVFSVSPPSFTASTLGSQSHIPMQPSSHMVLPGQGSENFRQNVPPILQYPTFPPSYHVSSNGQQASSLLIPTTLSTFNSPIQQGGSMYNTLLSNANSSQQQGSFFLNQPSHFLPPTTNSSLHIPHPQPIVSALSSSPSQFTRQLNSSASQRSHRPIYVEANIPLHPGQVLEILKSKDVPFNTGEDFAWAEGGTVWLFKADSMFAAEDWRKAGHIMKQVNGGARVHARSDPSAVIVKKCAALVTSERKSGDPRFKRYSWTWEGRPLHVVIQYIGDHNLSEPLYHGNAKSCRAMPRNPALPSLAMAVEASKEKPATLYDKMKMNAGSTATEQRMKVPSSKSQIKDLQKNYRRLSGSTDIFSILFRLSREYPSMKLLIFCLSKDCDGASRT